MKILGLVSMLVALLIVAILARHQLAGVHAPAAAVPDSTPGGPVPHRVDTPPAARQVQQQVHDDVSKMMQDRTSQVDQSLEGK